MITRDEVSILFSGGSDSTLTAALMCEQFDKVYLLTFFHSGIPNIERTKINANRLALKYGKDRINQILIDIEEVFKKIYYMNYFEDLKKYKTFMVSCSCDACQLAMHTMTIIYNIKNKIRFTCDGYKAEKEHIYSFMSKDGIKEIRKFYSNFGLEYQNPVYNIIRTDWVLYEMGITTNKNVKFPNEGLNFSTQHHCHNGILVNAFLMGYYNPMYGNETAREISINYWREKVELSKQIICETVESIDVIKR